jgi:cell wall-associated NlpC family hydrolase
MTAAIAVPRRIRDTPRMPAGFLRPHRRGALLLALAFAIAPAAYGQSAEAPRTFASSAAATASKLWTGAQDVAGYALGLIGVDYKFGGNTPETGLDCSGLVRYVFQEVTGFTLPRTSKELSGLGAKIGLAELKPGDLVFFNTRRFPNSHVGIYLGDNTFIHAPSRGREVEVAQLSSSYWQKHFNGARRLVGVLPALVPSLIAPAYAGAPVTALDFGSEPVGPVAPDDAADAHP